MVVHFGEFAVDFGSRQLLRGARAVHVGPKAFELLHALLEARPRALSKVELSALTSVGATMIALTFLAI